MLKSPVRLPEARRAFLPGRSTSGPSRPGSVSDAAEATNRAEPLPARAHAPAAPKRPGEMTAR